MYWRANIQQKREMTKNHVFFKGKNHGISEKSINFADEIFK